MANNVVTAIYCEVAGEWHEQLKKTKWNNNRPLGIGACGMGVGHSRLG